MARDFEALYRAQAEARTASNTNLTVSLPPGYLVGYDVRLRQDYTVVITAGAANVGGRLVQITEDHQLADADWVAPKINSTRHYYIYLSKAGQWFVDIVAPVWNNEFLYYEQPDTNWRAVGKIFLADSQIIFAIKEVEKNEQTVTVAPAGFTGRADYYCTGENDQILINAAIRYLHEAYDGGGVHCLSGLFYPSNTIVLDNNITLSGDGRGTTFMLSQSVHGFYLAGDSGLDKTNMHLKDFNISTTQTAQNTVYLIYANNSSIDNLSVICTNGNAPNGIICYGDSNSIRNCIVDHFSKGITASGDYNIVYANICKNNYWGILCGGEHDKISSNICKINSVYGLILSGNYLGISNNYAADGGATSIGIYISGSNNSLTSNYCYNNGSDAGLDNTNQNNFSDAGTDTQVYSNSWQQPVAGEPTQGELKWLASTSASWSLLNGGSAVTWTTITCASFVPAGAKTVYLRGSLNAYASSAALINAVVSAQPGDGPSTTILSNSVGIGGLASATGAAQRFSWHGEMFCKLDSSRNIMYKFTATTRITDYSAFFSILGYKS